ncbi:hypothetical protein ElyMa_006739100 [Elysia marginata]|uniref:Secreted protein n=1 Tax=Elysia marginata TaxID=1093978 RepID=A0AAV4IW17_9GAST|nr:hypothetical protein ElyMa_006739100 [Elysia marginata]
MFSILLIISCVASSLLVWRRVPLRLPSCKGLRRPQTLKVMPDRYNHPETADGQESDQEGSNPASRHQQISPGPTPPTYLLISQRDRT